MRSYPSFFLCCPSHINDAHLIVKDTGIIKKDAYPIIKDTHPLGKYAFQGVGNRHPGIGGIGNMGKGMGIFENSASIVLKDMGNIVKVTSIVVDDAHPFLHDLNGKLKNDAF